MVNWKERFDWSEFIDAIFDSDGLVTKAAEIIILNCDIHLGMESP